MRATLDVSAVIPIERVRVGAFRIPTDASESDGTLEWNATTLVVVEITGAGQSGLGYTYGDAAIARLVQDSLQHDLLQRDAMAIDRLWHSLFARLRNGGRQGASAMAVSAIDVALWDLKAKHLGTPLVCLLGPTRKHLPLYGSGGFTSYTNHQMRQQFEAWQQQGISRFKMKVGRNPSDDSARARTARAIIGDSAELFVDANSAYTRMEAREWGQRFANEGNVRWLEQPIAPEDLTGLHFLREQMPAGLEIADGEYGYDLDYFRRLILAEAVDVVMADVTRCGGVTGFMKVAALCEAWKIPLSSHCAPALHLHPGCAASPLRHAEYFHDHARIEAMFLDGVAEVKNGGLEPDLSRPGHGYEFKWADAEDYAI